MRISDWSSDVCSSDLDRDAIFALQAFVQRFDGLHCLGLILAQNLVSNPAKSGGTPHDPGLHCRMVRAKGLDPPHLEILVPQTSASTNSATPARVSGRELGSTSWRDRG